MTIYSVVVVNVLFDEASAELRAGSGMLHCGSLPMQEKISSISEQLLHPLFKANVPQHPSGTCSQDAMAWS